MSKPLLILLLLSLLATTARAQVNQESLPSQQLKQRLRGQYLHNDTAQAIITLYSRRQAGGASWVVASILSAVRVGTAAGSTGSTYNGSYTPQSDNGSNVGVAFLAASPLAAYGVGKLLHYSNKNLEQVLTAYAAGQPLPRSLRRKLKPRFFQAPIVQYKKVKYKSTN